MSIENYEPLGPFILLTVIEGSLDVSEGGIVLPDIAKAKSNKGRVIAVGEGMIVDGHLLKPAVEPGDTVLFSKYGGTEVSLDGNKYTLVRMDECYLRERRVALVT